MYNLSRNFLQLVIILFIAASIGFAQFRDGLNLNRAAEKLKLTDAQKTQISNLQTSHQKVMVDLRAKLEKSRIELKEITRKNDFTRNEYIEAQRKMIKIREEIQLASANHKMDILELMDAEQRKIFADLTQFKGRNKEGCCFNKPRFHRKRR
ncbi:MAG: Spy/CpxP family protein refolding chaperone [Ignavibacteriaceae bacterium]|nr:Spy/CpxP family protein refolding chaperone [Ignavibacteriaceae bacterium]